MHPLFILSIATFAIVAAFLGWSLLSTKRHRFNRDVAGPGGSNDPISGKTEGMRDPDELRASLDQGGLDNGRVAPQEGFRRDQAA